MKKLLRIAVVLGMVLCLSVSALAGSTSGTMINSAVDSNGQSVNVEEAASPVTLTAQESANIIDVVDQKDLAADDVTVAWIRDIHVDIPEGGSVTITFDVPGVADDQNVYVFHHDGTKWNLVGEGKGSVVTATFTSLSPVAIVVEKLAEAPSVPSTPGTESPKTGEAPVLLVAAAVALFAGAVAVVTMKKREEM